MSSSKVTAYLEDKVAAVQETDAALAAEWDTIRDLYTRKLWHQLTIKLLEFVRNDIFETGTGLVELYENLLKDLEDRMNPFMLVRLIYAVIAQISDPLAAVALMGPIKEKIKYDTTATISLNTIVAQLNMQQGKLKEAKELLDECNEQLDSLPGVTPVHSDYYKASSYLCKIQGRHADYYRESLRFLGTVDVSTLTVQESVERAYDMGLSALVGKGIYNMGELLSHSILDSLRGTEKEWLVNLLTAFNSGDVRKFAALQPQWSAQSPDLAECTELLNEKVKLLSLMEIVFTKQAKNRSVTFDEVATAADIPPEQVEILIMKGLSLGLVKGTIDEIDQQASFHWVQPRVLDLDQLTDMHARLGTWLDTVNAAVSMVENTAPELLVGN
jgi:26S proteasome regulatory subunit N9